MGPKWSPVRILEAFEHELSFRQKYNFFKMHKELAYNSDIPHLNSSLLVNRIKIRFEVKWYIIADLAHDLIETYTYNSSSKDCLPVNCPKYLKQELLLLDSKADVDLVSFLHWQHVQKKTVKVNKTIPFCQVIPKCVETISNLTRHIYRIMWASCQL